MTMMTQKERLAALEAEGEAHAREHELTERVWAAKLEAIDARLRSIERFLLDAPHHGAAYQNKRLQRRDIIVMGGSAGVTSIFWLAVEFGLRVGLGG